MNPLPIISLDEYDFADFGSGTKGSFDFAIRSLGGLRGIALDINGGTVHFSRSTGIDVQVSNVGTIAAELEGTVRFVLISHILQKLPSISAATSAIDAAVRLSDEFVFILQPSFDADDYLSSLDVKTFWSDWSSHRNKMTSSDYRAVLEEVRKQGKINGYIIFGRRQIKSSEDSAIHPIGSPANQGPWAFAMHERKRKFKFVSPVFKEIGAVVWTRERDNASVDRYLKSVSIIYHE